MPSFPIRPPMLPKPITTAMSLSFHCCLLVNGFKKMHQLISLVLFRKDIKLSKPSMYALILEQSWIVYSRGRATAPSSGRTPSL